MKKEVDHVDATPSKRLFLSIIADYELNRSVCELIDNALDIWFKTGRSGPLNIQIDLDKNQQTIHISDNAGGVKKDDLRVIVGPGHTSNLPTDEVIGIFGVGTKRAVVALAQDIMITTRYEKDKTYRVEFDDSWLQTENWELPVYEVDEIAEGTTIIELHKLRITITEEAISQLKDHLSATYARFLTNNLITVKCGTDQLRPISFKNWAYPPGYEPRRYVSNLLTEDGGTVRVEVIAGLTTEASPAGGEYGVYFYCNNRLIARGLKSYDVGFTKGLAGQPHPSVSLVRVIVSLNGEARLMPWNSSKSGINPNHHVFVALRTWLVQVVKDYASLSRRLEGCWPEKVFKYSEGKIKKVKIDNLPEATKSYLPPLPKSKLRYGDLVKQINRRLASEKPWTRGLYESVIAVDLIFKQKLEQKNRICLILLDSTLEIAFKEFLVNGSGQTYNDTKLLSLFNNRQSVHDEIKNHVSLSNEVWKKIRYYYQLRCKLVHERATVGITDEQIEDFREIVQKILKKLFKLNFEMEGD
ncbi:MAG: ATP-binding protein [Euryarchaeota archaeon]|nr:ATP-binding protein [Euryarchaeota archaeon]